MTLQQIRLELYHLDTRDAEFKKQFAKIVKKRFDEIMTYILNCELSDKKKMLILTKMNSL